MTGEEIKSCEDLNLLEQRKSEIEDSIDESKASIKLLAERTCIEKRIDDIIQKGWDRDGK